MVDVTLHCTPVGDPFTFPSADFVIEGTSNSCVLFDGPSDPITITNLTANGYRIFWNNLTAQCIQQSQGLNSNIGPNGTIVINASSVDVRGPGIRFTGQIQATGIELRIRVQTPAPPVDCQYGTRLKAGFSSPVVLTPDLLDLVLAFAQASPLRWFIAILELFNLDVALLCARGPDPPPPLTNSSGTLGLNFWLQWFRSIAWNYFCECVPGTPAPRPPVQPVIIIPGGTPVQPSFPCDPAALCGALTNLGLQLQALKNQNAANTQLVTLLQRYLLPFSYVRGSRFSTLTASGSVGLGTERAVGLLIEVTRFPPDNKQLLGAPVYIFDLGWISVLDGDGMIDEIRLTRQATVWLSKLIPTATIIGWGLRDGVTAEITALHAEA